MAILLWDNMDSSYSNWEESVGQIWRILDCEVLIMVTQKQIFKWATDYHHTFMIDAYSQQVFK